ncbi:MAG: hypothetical protein Q4P05_04670 [Actinomycetaceae bacterium]|nr:hypothetical protein [Actinomycetaceae bacterium]
MNIALQLAEIAEFAETVVVQRSGSEIGTSLSASGLLDSLSSNTTLFALAIVSIPLAIARGLMATKRVDL